MRGSVLLLLPFVAACKAPDPPRRTYSDAQRAAVEAAIGAMNERAARLDAKRLEGARLAEAGAGASSLDCPWPPDLARLTEADAASTAVDAELRRRLDVLAPGEPSQTRADAEALSRRWHDLLFAEPNDAEEMVRDAKDELDAHPVARPLLLVVRAEAPGRVDGTLVLFGPEEAPLCVGDVRFHGAGGAGDDARDGTRRRAAASALGAMRKLAR